jgi:MFS family permease
MNRTILRYRGFRLLLAGLAASQAGDWLYNLALITLVYQRTHSPMWAGLTTAARVVPMVALGPFGGIVAGRFDRRRTMIACDLIRMALMGVLALVTVASLPVVAAPLIAAAATAAAAPYLPAVSATTPRLVADADLPGANAARSAVTGIGIIVGPALGGVLLLLGSPSLAFVLNAVTFGLSALAVLAIPGRAAFQPALSTERPAGVFREVADGAAVLCAHPQTMRLVGADLMCSLIYGMQTVLLIGVARRAGLGLHGYGYLFAGIGVGALLGTALAGRAVRCPHPRAVLLTALAAVGLPMPLLAVTHWPALAIALVALTGIGAISVEILTETSLQRALPPEAFGRVYGLAIPASIGGIVLGSLLAPALLTLLGLTATLTASGLAVAAYALLLLLRTPSPASASAPALVSAPAPALVSAEA